MMAFALFIDILGTRALVEASSPDICEPAAAGAAHNDGPEPREYRLVREEFTAAIQAASSLSAADLMFRASFSDCAYLVYSTPSGICRAAYLAMWSLYRRCVPARGGLGQGTFFLGRTRHGTEASHCFTEAEFHGSCITRAYAAESCGLRGLRVFVHESAFEALREVHAGVAGFRPFDWSKFEEGDPRPDSCAVAVPLEEAVDRVVAELSPLGNSELEEYLRAVDMMQRRFPSGVPSAVEQYERTREALLRMHALRMAS
jgi:hypothetical protein